MWKKIVFLIISVILLGMESVLAMPVSVTLRNGTTGNALGEYPFSIEMRDEKTGRIVKELKLRTDGKGTYRGEVKPEKGVSTIAMVSYRGVTYRSLPEKKAGTGLSFDLNVYEITDRADNITIPHRTMVISPQDDRTVQVFEVLIIRNTGKMTFVGSFNDDLDTEQVLFIPMPLGYRLSQLQGMDTRKIQTFNGGLVTQEPIPPGEKELVLGYFLRSDTGLFDLSLFPGDRGPFQERTSLLLKEDAGWKLRASGLESSGKTDFYGKRYRVWTGEGNRGFKISLYGPAYRSSYGGWSVVLLSAFLISGVLLFFGRKSIRSYYLDREKDRIRQALSFLKAETSGNGYYLPIIRVLEARVEELSKKDSR